MENTEYRLTVEHERATEDRKRMIAQVIRKREAKRHTLARKAARREAWALKGRA